MLGKPICLRGGDHVAAEKNFENRVKRWLESEGIYALGTPKQKIAAKPIGYYEKRWGGGNFTKSGLPDMHIVVNGKSIDIELKAPNGRPSDLQLFTINQINSSGGKAFIVYPKDFDKLKTIIKEVKNNGNTL